MSQSLWIEKVLFDPPSPCCLQLSAVVVKVPFTPTSAMSDRSMVDQIGEIMTALQCIIQLDLEGTNGRPDLGFLGE